MPTQNSSGVASSVPSTFPMGRLSAKPDLLEQPHLKGAADELGVAESVPQHRLECTHGIQVLRRTRVPPRLTRETRQNRTGEISERACRVEATGRTYFEPHDPRYRPIDRSLRRHSQIPRVALESLLAELEDWRPLARE